MRLDHCMDRELLNELLIKHNIVAANGFMNDSYKRHLDILAKGNELPIVGRSVNESVCRSPFEKQIYDYIVSLNVNDLVKKYGLEPREWGRPFPHFLTRFNNIAQTIGRGLTYSQKCNLVNSGGFNNEAKSFEQELTTYYNQIKELSDQNGRYELKPDHSTYVNYCEDQTMKISLKPGMAKAVRSDLTNIAKLIVKHHLEMLKDTEERELVFKSYELAIDYAGCAVTDLFLLNSVTNYSIRSAIDAFAPYVKIVEVFRSKVLLQSYNGMFDINVYQDYFYNALREGQTNFDCQVLLPTQYVFNAVNNNVNKLGEGDSGQLTDDTLALFVASLLRYDSLIGNDEIVDIGDKMVATVDEFGPLGMFSISARI